MGKYKLDEALSAAVSREQDIVMSKTEGMAKSIERCPYCKHLAGTVYRPMKKCGVTAVIKSKCRKCGSEFFLPISFRMSV